MDAAILQDSMLDWGFQAWISPLNGTEDKSYVQKRMPGMEKNWELWVTETSWKNKMLLV